MFQENVKQKNSSYDFLTTIDNIQMYLDIYHTLSSHYEYIGTKSEPTPKREYFDFGANKPSRGDKISGKELAIPAQKSD